MEIVIVMKTNVSVIFELKCDDGSSIHLDKCDEEMIIRQWQRKFVFSKFNEKNFRFESSFRTYRIQTNKLRLITDVYIEYQRTAETNIRLGFFSVRNKDFETFFFVFFFETQFNV